MVTEIKRREIEEGVLSGYIQFECIQFGRFKFLVWSDASAAINNPPQVRLLHILRVFRRGPLSVVVVEERNVRIVPLNQTPAGSVIVLGGEGKPGVVAQRVNGLHQTLTECRVAQYPGAVMILQRTRYNLRSGGRITVHENNNRVALAIPAAMSQVGLFGIGAPFMRNNHLATVQPAAGGRHTFL